MAGTRKPTARPTGKPKTGSRRRDASGRAPHPPAARTGGIAERRRMEEALRKNEALLQAAGRMASVGWWELETPSLSLSWSDEVYRIHEVDPASAPDIQSAIAFYTPESRPVISRAVQRALEHGEPFDLELQLLTAKGNRRWVHAIGKARQVHGRTQTVFGTFQDITARRHMEEALRDNERILRESQRIAHVGSWRLDVATNQVVWSEELYTMYGFDPAFPPPPYTEHMKLFTPESWERLSASLARTRDTGIPYELELKTLRKDGTQGWMWVRGEAIRDSQGAIVALWGAAQDITDRKRTEEELAERALRYTMLADSGQALIWTSGLDKKCDYFNKPWLRFTGRTLEQELGDGWAEGVHPDDLARCVEIYTGSFDRREPFSMTYRLRRHDGEYRWIQDNGTPNYNIKGDFIGYLGHCLDITDLKRAEEELIQARDAAEAANRAKSAFLATMSHELRTPMNGIMGFTDLALQCAVSPEQQSYLTIVQNRSRDLLLLLNDILDLSRIEAGRLELTPTPFSVATLVSEVLQMMALPANKKNLTLDKTLAPDLPRELHGDVQRLRQVLVNLVGNAVKFTDQGGVRVLVDRDPDSGADARHVPLHFRVQDTGIGIPADQAEAIFLPFTQADHSLTRKHDGAGLGLAIVKRLVEIMGGKVWVESEPGKGSTFHFTASLSLPPPSESEVGSALPAEPERTRRPLRVLVAEDDEASRLLAARLPKAPNP